MATQLDADRFLTVNEIKGRLGISRTKAYEIATNGSLETVKIGRSLRISERSVVAWLTSQRYPALKD